MGNEHEETHSLSSGGENSLQKAAVCLRLAGVRMKQEKDREAMEQIREALSLAEGMNESDRGNQSVKEFTARCLGVMAELQLRSGDHREYVKARESAKRALALLRELPEAPEEARAAQLDRLKEILRMFRALDQLDALTTDGEKAERDAMDEGGREPVSGGSSGGGLFFRLLSRKKAPGTPREQYQTGYHRYLTASGEADFTAAWTCFNEAGGQGYAPALCMLGECAFYGNGTAQNLQEAVMYYRRAAEAGDSYAMYNLGYCLVRGYGTAPDPAEAVKWLTKAGDDAQTEAQLLLGTLYWLGIPDGRQDAEKAAWWWQAAADMENTEGIYRLGLLFDTGKGVAMDHHRAVALYTRAALDKHAGALSLLEA